MKIVATAVAASMVVTAAVLALHWWRSGGSAPPVASKRKGKQAKEEATAPPFLRTQSREMAQLSRSVTADASRDSKPVELDDAVFLWCSSRLLAQGSDAEALEEKRTILSLLMQSSSTTSFIERIAKNGVLDACFSVCQSTPSLAADAAFVLANCSSNPVTHPYFFSTRFHLEPLVQRDRTSALQIMLNLTHHSSFSCRQACEKLNVLPILAAIESSEPKAVAQIRHNLQVNLG
jgi:hypothetical protein